MRNFILLISLSLIILSCNESKNKTSAFEKQKNANNHPGKKLMEINCYSCHSITGGEKNRIAPPMIAIKKHYINENTSKEEFIEAIQAWTKNPNKNDTKMPGAINRFGVMPKLPYSKEMIKQIADYMYDFDIEEPEWFEEHFKTQQEKMKKQGLMK